MKSKLFILNILLMILLEYSIAKNNVLNINVGGTIRGLEGSKKIFITDNLSFNVPVLEAGNGEFTIPYNYNIGAEYFLEVRTPVGVYCLVTNSSGGPLYASITIVDISCQSTADSFIIMGNGGLFKTSLNGIDAWNNFPVDLTTTINSIVYNTNRKSIAVGANGIVLYSDNGYNWFVGWAGISKNLVSIANIDDTYVTVGNGGTILSSIRGSNWTVENYGEDIDFKEVSTCKRSFYVLSNNGSTILLQSSNGLVWNYILEKWSFVGNSVTCSGSGNVILAGEYGFYYSTNGVNFRQVTIRGIIFNKVINFRNILYAVGTNGSRNNPGVIYSSSDQGVTWRLQAQQFPEELKSIAANSIGTFIAVSTTSAYLSTDAIHWTREPYQFIGINNVVSSS